MENKFLEAIRKLVEYGNREFLRSFQLRSGIKENSGNGNGNNGDKNNNTFIITDVASLVPPFDTIGFLEAKWLEVLKELVEYGNKNILGNFALYLVMEERRGEQYVKEVTSGILDIKKEKSEVHHNGYNNSNNNNNQSWSRPRDKNGRFISSSNNTSAGTATTTTPVAIHNNTTAATTAMTIPTPCIEHHRHSGTKLCCHFSHLF
jgi:hypothetical protein